MSTLLRLGALCACALFSASCLAAERRLAHLDLEVALDPESRDFRATAQLEAPSASRFCCTTPFPSGPFRPTEQ
jgi:hypothetical protein